MPPYNRDASEAPVDRRSPNSREVLEEKIEKYEHILERVLQEPKQVAYIEAGPFEDGDIRLYKVKAGGGTVVVNCPDDLFFDSKIEDLEKGTEVMILKGAIISIMPKELIIEEETPRFSLIDWADIGGLKSQLDSIREAIEFPIKHAKLAKELGLSPLKGILLYGPPGCGKTMIAKAVASTVLGAKDVDAEAFTYVKGGEMLSKYVGGAEERIVNMFRRSRDYMKKTGNKAVIFIDEAEAIMPARGSRVSSDVEKTIVPTFLAEMDGFEEVNPFILLATNLPGDIDAAVIREGRIDLKVPIERPDLDDTMEIFDIHLSKVKCAGKVNDMSKKISENLFADTMLAKKVSGALAETIVKVSVQKAMSRKIKDPSTPTGVVIEDLCEAMKSM